MSKSAIKRPNSNTPSFGTLYRQRARYIHITHEIVPAERKTTKDIYGVEHTITIPVHAKRVNSSYRKLADG